MKRQIKSSEGGLKRRVVFAKGFVFKVFGEGWALTRARWS